MTASATAAAPGGRDNPYLDETSLEFRFRARRFALIRRLIERILDERGRADILDLGGAPDYWLAGGAFIEANRARLSITMVNIEEQTVARPDLFTFVAGSATDPDLFRGRTFDLVHSNSVIEHVGDLAAMQRFADNARRLAPRYYVQTPNYWFPFEPHFRFAGIQYVPEPLRAWLMTKYAFGFFPRIADIAVARDLVSHHRLLSMRQMRRLFPDGTLQFEKAFGLNKSIIAWRDRTP